MRGLPSCCRLGGSSARLQLLKRLGGRPCRALSFRPYGLPRVWSPLQGYTPWALKRTAPIGAYLPSRSQQSEEYNLQHKGPRASHPPPRYCASIHGRCGIPSQGAAVCAPKAPQFYSRALRYFLPRCCSMCSQGTAVLLTGTAVFPPKVQQYVHLRVLQYVLPRHRSSAHEYCGISSRGTAVCAPKGVWYVSPRHRCSSNGIVVFPPKVLRSGYPRVRGCTLPKVVQFLPRRYSMRLQGVPGVAACRVEPL